MGEQDILFEWMMPESMLHENLSTSCNELDEENIIFYINFRVL